MSDVYDILIIGGGIHGAGIARDAAGRGLRVALCEQGDFAGATSSASSKLIHGGLRYLEHGDLRLVHEALHEREVLLRIAPHISHPLRFVLPHVSELRPAWMIRIGLLLYDRLSARTALPASKSIDLRTSAYGDPLVPDLRKGFTYFDAATDDARLVILNLKSAAQHGAQLLPRTRLVSATPQQQGWRVTLSAKHGITIDLQARVLINAAGPWVDQVRASLSPTLESPRCRLVKGSHIVLPRLYLGDYAYLLQSRDRRVVFLLPFGDSHTLIGTTDVPVEWPVTDLDATTDEIAYLCAVTARFLRNPAKPEQVVHSFSGVRALLDDGHANPSAVTRDYSLLVENVDDAVVLSIIGGKLTTYRHLAESALEKLAPHLPPLRAPWTDKEVLPGGDLGPGGIESLQQSLHSRYPQLPSSLLDAVAVRHGTLASAVLGNAIRESDLGIDFGGGLYSREVDYLIDAEWARSADDVLWRRTKVGLRGSAEMRERLERYIRARAGVR